MVDSPDFVLAAMLVLAGCNASVNEDMTIAEGTSRSTPSVTVNGELRFEQSVRLFIHDSATVGEISGAEAGRYSG